MIRLIRHTQLLSGLKYSRLLSGSQLQPLSSQKFFSLRARNLSVILYPYGIHDQTERFTRFQTPCVPRIAHYSTGSSEFDDESPVHLDDSTLEDAEYDAMVKEHYFLPDGGHRVLIIQPGKFSIFPISIKLHQYNL